MQNFNNKYIKLMIIINGKKNNFYLVLFSFCLFHNFEREHKHTLYICEVLKTGIL